MGDREIEELIKPHDTTFLGQISSEICCLGFATRSKAPQSSMEHRRMWDYQCEVPEPPSTSYTLNMHIFLMKPQIHSPPPSIPPLPAPHPTSLCCLATPLYWRTKALHCFPAIHSGCLKVPASEGRKGRLYIHSIFICAGSYAHRHTMYGEEENSSCACILECVVS